MPAPTIQRTTRNTRRICGHCGGKQPVCVIRYYKVDGRQQLMCHDCALDGKLIDGAEWERLNNDPGKPFYGAQPSERGNQKRPA